MKNIIGREREIAILNNAIDSSNSEFIALYGRRRVGKTFLIRSIFKGQFAFQISGLSNSSLKQQLANFNLTLNNTDTKNDYEPVNNWLSAFSQLTKHLKSKKGRKIIFIDELPWFDTRNSKFIQALEHFWNSWASAESDIKLIVCGSATSWMVNKLINNKGGLHNRLTHKIKLLPFTLNECEKYLSSRKINLDKYQIIQLYMSIGGIPFYWDEVKPGLSAMQNIEEICFSETGLLQNEFNNLYRSLFNNYDKHIKIVKALAKKSKGLNRDEIIKITGLPNAGSTSRVLDELEESGFIRKYSPFEKRMRNSLYQLIDFYSHFYLKFIENTQITNTNNWLNAIDTPKYRAWSGYAYEQICLSHLAQIKNKLGISGVFTTVSSWRSTNSEQGVQIDLIIDRRDNIINLCEMKFSINPYTISKKYASELRDKVGVFKAETNTRKSVFLTMITTYGIKQNINSTGLFQNEMKMDDLFISLE